MSLTPPSTELPDPLETELSDDYESLAMDACQLLSETDAQFIMSGFGQDEWPVDVSYDLSTVIEQLPSAMESLRQGRSTEIDLYGQGIERRLIFTTSNNVTEIRCVSRTSWRPHPEVETVPHDEALKLLAGLAGEFGAALRRAAPEFARRTPFATW
ncbi:hypothetical protein [Streptomyces sp. NPDC002232]|uniref:hypothetical protein n=1 Tax=Streptomyces sp. NPDC002232 TaxID=3364640 RepID=UPI0036B76CD0